MDQATARTLVRVRWRDGRLWLGVGLIIIAMLIGSRVISHSDERVTVWRATHDLSIGSAPIDLEPVAVSLGDASGDYARASSTPSGVLTRPVAAGELLPASSLGVIDSVPMRVITLPVEPLHAPVGLLPGDRVDIWSTPTESTASPVPMLVERQAMIASVTVDTMGVGGEIGVAVQVPEARADALIAALRGGAIDLVAVPIEAQA